MGDNLNLPDRNGVRTPMQWDDSPNGGFTTGVPFTEMVQGGYGYQKVNVAEQMESPHSLLRAIQKMISIRKQHREQDGESILVLNNLSDTVQFVKIPPAYQNAGRELFSNRTFSIEARLELQPFSYLWIQLQS
jgi:maltose alpha-D-glucosyltransferase/alpha-amylase